MPWPLGHHLKPAFILVRGSHVASCILEGMGSCEPLMAVSCANLEDIVLGTTAFSPDVDESLLYLILPIACLCPSASFPFPRLSWNSSRPLCMGQAKMEHRTSWVLLVQCQLPWCGSACRVGEEGCTSPSPITPPGGAHP